MRTVLIGFHSNLLHGFCTSLSFSSLKHPLHAVFELQTYSLLEETPRVTIDSTSSIKYGRAPELGVACNWLLPCNLNNVPSSKCSCFAGSRKHKERLAANSKPTASYNAYDWCPSALRLVAKLWPICPAVQHKPRLRQCVEQSTVSRLQQSIACLNNECHNEAAMQSPHTAAVLHSGYFLSA
jgi:hypothetical protein